MHHISKNWEPIFDFQYKVVVGQCVESALAAFCENFTEGSFVGMLVKVSKKVRGFMTF